jgi:sugar O-acyltransferase (sialic acid O-acetyltransferase NeuD family)
MKKNIIIVGYSGHSYVVTDVINSNEELEIIGYLDIENKLNKKLSIPYLGNDDFINENKDFYYFPTIGDNNIRKKIVEKLVSNKTKPITITSLFSNISSYSIIGDYTFIARNSLINTFSKIGTGCIINSGAIIEHECEVGDFVHICPGATLLGNVKVGELSFIGANSVIKQGITIGKNVIVGAGSVVLKDIKDNEMWAGNPAKKIRSNSRKMVQFNESIKIFTTKNSDEWNNFLSCFPEHCQDIYFTSEYIKIQEEEGFGEGICFTYRKGNNLALYAFLKNEVSNERFKLNEQFYDIETAYGYGGPIFNTDNNIFIEEFYAAFNNYCNKSNIVAEFVRFHPLIKNNPNKKYISNFKDRNTVKIDISKNYYEIWENQYQSSNRNKIRKAQTNDLKIEIISNPLDVDIFEFTKVYNQTMTKLGADDFYHFSFNYIKNTFNYLSKKCYLFNVVNRENELVCTSIFFKFNDNFHYHLSARTEISDNNVNNFLLDSAVQFAQSIGCKVLHLGGGRTNNPEDSLLKFKQSFSKENGEFYIGKKIHNIKIYNDIINTWESQNPDKKEELKNILLRYKF